MTKRIYPFIAVSSLLAIPVALAVNPAYPQWWLTQGVVDPADYPPPATEDPAYEAWMADNYKVPNLGQAKSLAKAAYQQMVAETPELASSPLNTMISAFSTAPEDNYVALNVGQLKALAAPFYNQMHAEYFQVILSDGTIVAYGAYPWDDAPTGENYSLATLGQLKYAFSFYLADWELFSPPTPPSGMDNNYCLITMPGARTYAVVGQSISIEAIASFVGDSVAGIEFFVNAVSLGAADTSAPFQDSWTPSSSGDFFIHAVAESGGSSLINAPFIFVTIQDDINANGLGDDWESTTGISSPSNDGDGDGQLAADEYASGGNPAGKDHPIVKLEIYGVAI